MADTMILRSSEVYAAAQQIFAELGYLSDGLVGRKLGKSISTIMYHRLKLTKLGKWNLPKGINEKTPEFFAARELKLEAQRQSADAIYAFRLGVMRAAGDEIVSRGQQVTESRIGDLTNYTRGTIARTKLRAISEGAWPYEVCQGCIKPDEDEDDEEVIKTIQAMWEKTPLPDSNEQRSMHPVGFTFKTWEVEMLAYWNARARERDGRRPRARKGQAA